MMSLLPVALGTKFNLGSLAPKTLCGSTSPPFSPAHPSPLAPESDASGINAYFLLLRFTPFPLHWDGPFPPLQLSSLDSLANVCSSF